MDTARPSWERRVLALADEGTPGSLREAPPAAAPTLLRQAYGHCDRVAKDNSATFYLASGLLPAEQRRAVRALYAFCRVTDDVIDRSEGDLAAGLADWEECAMAEAPTCEDLVALAWADTRARYRIPARYAEQLVRGVAKDLIKTRYASFEELAEYCYGVASTVGLMAMHIVGFSGREAIPYAVNLGIAMQITNILRDVKEDWEAGRVYLPQDELAAFGLGDDDIAGATNTERWRRFMRFQIARNWNLYREATPGIAMLNPKGRFAIAAAAGLYQGILEEIEARDGDVFTRRVELSAPAKLRRLPGMWWRYRRAGVPDARDVLVSQVERELPVPSASSIAS